MSDEMAERVERENQEQATKTPGRSVTLAITLHPNGQMEFQLPLNNRILAFGLLGAAFSKLCEMYTINELKAMPKDNGTLGWLKKILE